MLDKYVMKAVDCLERYQAKKLAFREVDGRHPFINENIDGMYQALSLAHLRVSVEWKQQWEEHRQNRQQATATTVKNAKVVLRELQGAQSQLEVILTFKFEAEKRGQQHSEEMKRCVQSTMPTVVSASKVAVPKLPPWFLPSYEVEFDREPFVRGSYGMAHTSVVK